ncbi:hypothetical protein H9636_05170 [Ureibacillus sp. Re31]|uniref:Uncharacterized protein n=1 Tax=Ureibacillus galli TaxID=2762222 RepID=A0ABR8X9P1_9BACL|nr:hypothetical protein [Ureibacillus galli]MBD8026044.1 hypothetical protein [Ureibacillus galli]
MIYKKDANFPYPILTNTSSSYKNSNFILDVQLQENVHHYRFDIDYEIDSEFINQLIEKGNAELFLIIQSKDNKFYRLDNKMKYIEVPKTRISLSNRSSIQLHIQAKVDVEFKNNNDLNDFYNEFKEEIIVPENSLLGFSNVVLFEGSSTKPLDLFEKKLNPHLSSDIKIELGSETIIIHYKNEESQFNTLPMNNTLNNPYIYMGLQKALQRFISNQPDEDDSVDIEQMEPPNDLLDLKLYNLMKKKMIQELSMDTIDEVIYAISDRIIEKYVAAVKGLSSNGS